MNLQKIIITMCFLMTLSLGCNWEKKDEVPPPPKTAEQTFVEGDSTLIETAKVAFEMITKAEEAAISTEADPQTKKTILLKTLRAVAAQSLLKAYEKAWDEGALGITLTVKSFSEGMVVEKSLDRAVVKVTIKGTLNNESGSIPTQDTYRLTMVNDHGRWLLKEIDLVNETL